MNLQAATASERQHKQRARGRRKSAPRRRRYLIALMAAAVIALAYAMLPVWLPTGWLAGRTADWLAELMRRPVHVDSLQIGWRTGVRITGLQMDRRADFPAGPLLRVSEIHCGFTPLRTLWAGRVDHLVFDQAELWIVLDENGRLNVSDVASEGGSAPITHDWTFDGTTVHLVDLQRQQQHDLVLGTVRCRLDPRSAEARWQVDGQLLHALATERPIDERSRGLVQTDGAVCLPALNRAVELQGEGRIAWDRLDLDSLPVQWFGAGRLRRLAGRSHGELHVALNEHLEIAWRLDCRVDDFLCRWQKPDSPAGQISVSQLRLATAGHCDPAADYLHAHTLDVRMPGLRVADCGQPGRPAVQLDRLGAERMRVDVVGQADDIGLLRREIPELDLLLGPRLTAQGGCRFELRWSDAIREQVLEARLAGDQLEVAGGDWLHCEPELPSRADLQIRLRPDGRHLGQIEVELGALTATGEWQQDNAASGPIRLEALHGQVVCSELSSLCDLLPGVWQGVESPELSGPGRIGVNVARGTRADSQTVAIELDLPAETAVSLPPYLIKPAGRPLAAAALLTLQDNDWPVQRFELQADFGRGRLMIADRPSAEPMLVVQGLSPASEESTWQIDAHVAADVGVIGVEDWLALLPVLRESLPSQDGARTTITGDLSGEVRFDLTARADADTVLVDAWRVQSDTDATGSAIDWPDQLSKPAGRSARLQTDHRFDRQHPSLPNQHRVVLQLAGDELAADLASGPGYERLSAALQVRDAAGLLEAVPGLARRLQPVQMAGPMAVELHSAGSAERRTWTFSADATGLDLTTAGDEPVHKPAGTTLELHGHGHVDWPNDGNDAITVHLDHAEGQLADSHWSVQEGHAELDAADADDPIRDLRLIGSGTLVIDSALRRLHPAIERLAADNDLLGQVNATWRLDLTDGGLQLAGELDATRLNVSRADELIKPPGEPMVVAFDLTARRPGDPEGTTDAWDWQVNEVRGILGSAHAAASGQVRVSVDPAGGAALDHADLAGELWVPQLDHLASRFPPLQRWNLTGGVAMDLNGSLADGRWHLCTGQVRLLGSTAQMGRARLSASGTLDLSPGNALARDLRVSTGESTVWLNGRLAGWPDQTSGQLVMLADRLDFDELAMVIERFTGELGGESSDQADRPALDRLIGMNLVGRLHAHHAAFTEPLLRDLDPPVEENRYHLEELISDFELVDGLCRFPFQAMLFGGTVSGRVETNLAADDPQIEVVYVAKRVRPKGIVPELIRYDFPELHPRGRVTMINHTRQRLFTEPGEDNYPLGTGELIIEGGYYEGPAAQRWLARVFPGLNTARFHFRRMHDWIEKRPGGTSVHQMIYLGRYYHIYMQGISRADRTSEYEVGLDLLAALDSRFWADSGQGRIPIFNARVGVDEQGRRLPPDIKFVPPHRVLISLLRNNPLRAAYLALQRRLGSRS